MKELELYSAGTASSSFNTVPMDLGDFTACAIQVTFSSAGLGGTVKPQGSLDGSTWVDTATATTVTSGASQLINISGAGYRYVRLAWTYSAGAGTATVKALLKECPIKGA